MASGKRLIGTPSFSFLSAACFLEAFFRPAGFFAPSLFEKLGGFLVFIAFIIGAPSIAIAQTEGAQHIAQITKRNHRKRNIIHGGCMLNAFYGL